MPEKFQNNVNISIPAFQPNTEKIVRVYPNPVSNNLHVELIDLETAPYTIYNVAGQIIQKGTINKTAVINVQNLSKGMYYLRVSGRTVKFVKD
jgi:hypothetical protein